MIDDVVDRYGRIDVLANNAGIIAYQALHELSMSDWERVIATNQTGTFLGMRSVIPHMVSRRSGSIINVSSIWGNAAVPGAHAYHATKGAVRNMSKSAAISYAKDNVGSTRCTPVHQDATHRRARGGDQRVRRRADADGPPGLPEEIANGVVFLAPTRPASSPAQNW